MNEERNSCEDLFGNTKHGKFWFNHERNQLNSGEISWMDYCLNVGIVKLRLRAQRVTNVTKHCIKGFRNARLHMMLAIWKGNFTIIICNICILQFKEYEYMVPRELRSEMSDSEIIY